MWKSASSAITTIITSQGRPMATVSPWILEEKATRVSSRSPPAPPPPPRWPMVAKPRWPIMVKTLWDRWTVLPLTWEQLELATSRQACFLSPGWFMDCVYSMGYVIFENTVYGIISLYTYMSRLNNRGDHLSTDIACFPD